MALNLNLPKLGGIGAGSKTGAAIGGVKIPKTVNPKAFFSAPKTRPPAQQQTHSPYDQFMLDTPYDPTRIGSIAQSGYDTDLANATKLAGMGYLTNDQLNEQAANRATQVQGVAASLRDQLAGIQQASVQQSNVGGALLGQQNAAAAAGGPRIPGAPPVEGIPTGAATAVLASQGAGTGNYYGTLQAAAASSGAQNAQKAYDAGNTAITTQNAEKQKVLASLLAGVDPVSKREATYNEANQKVSAANIQTKLSVYQNLVNQSQFAATTGNKLAMEQAANDLRRYTAQLSSADKRTLNIQDNQTKIVTTNANNRTRTVTTNANNQARSAIAASGNRTKAQIAADNRTAANKRAADANKTRTTIATDANKTRLTTAQIAANKKTAAGSSKGFQVSYVLPQTSEVDLTTGKLKVTKAALKTKPVNAAVWDKYLASGPPGRRNLSILGLPNKTKIKSSVAKS